MKKKYFIFDLDDTLTNSYEINQQLFVDTFDEYKNSSTYDEQFLRDLHYRSRGTSMHTQFEEAATHLEIDIDSDSLVKKNEQIHIRSANKFSDMGTFEAAKEFLQMLKENNKNMSICTNRQYGSQQAIFAKNDIGMYFDHIISCIDEGHEKPDPFCLLDLIENKYQASKEEFIFFGDSKTDRDFASNAGIDFFIIDQYLNDRKFYKMILQSFF